MKWLWGILVLLSALDVPAATATISDTTAKSARTLDSYARRLKKLTNEYKTLEQQLSKLSQTQEQYGQHLQQEILAWEQSRLSLLRQQHTTSPAYTVAAILNNQTPRPGLSRLLVAQNQQNFEDIQQQAAHKLEQWQQLVHKQRTLEQQTYKLMDRYSGAYKAHQKHLGKLKQHDGALARQLSRAEPHNPLPAADVCSTLNIKPNLPISATVYKTFCPQAELPRYGATLHTAPLALLVSPVAGTVRFSGPHSDSGWVLIVQTATGQQHIFAGLLGSPLQNDDTVKLHQPLGRMPAQQPFLYWEQRNAKNKPVNPL